MVAECSECAATVGLTLCLACISYNSQPGVHVRSEILALMLSWTHDICFVMVPPSIWLHVRCQLCLTACDRLRMHTAAVIAALCVQVP